MRSKDIVVGARAAACGPTIQAGHVYLPHPSLFPWVVGLIHEAAGFPKSRHDDRVDALTQALNKMRRRVSVV